MGPLQNMGGCRSQVHRKLFEMVYTRWSVVVDYRGCLLLTLSVALQCGFLHRLVISVIECKLTGVRDILLSAMVHRVDTQ